MQWLVFHEQAEPICLLAAKSLTPMQNGEAEQVVEVQHCLSQ